MDKNLLETKPNYTECHATNDGWVDTKTGEVLVAIKNLKDRLGTVQSTEQPVKRGRGRPRKVRT